MIFFNYLIKMVIFLLLKPDGDVIDVDKNLSSSFKLEDTISLISVKGVITNKGKGKIERLHIWQHKNSNIHIYGWKNGAHDMITNHALPKPLEGVTYYGDLLIFMETGGILTDFPETSYIEFFNESYDEEYDNNDESQFENEEEVNEEVIEIEEEDEDNMCEDEEEIIVDVELQIEEEYTGI
jgi:hypothetical protein